MNDLEQRIRACELDNARLRRQLGRQRMACVAIALLVGGAGAIANAALKEASFDSIRAREIVVVDGQGSVRARLGGDLPDGVMAHGHVAKRGSKAAGLLIYDEEGIERGGNVTMDDGSNAMLTLDSKYHQAALFVAGPGADQTAALRLWSDAGSLELRADADGSRLSVADKTGVRLQQPAISLSDATCRDQKKLRQQYPGERICQARYTDAACQACFEQP